jgi:hypothetical protein
VGGASVFDRMEWDDRRVRVDDIEFRIVPGGADISDTTVPELRLFKTRAMLRRYEEFWARRPGFAARNIVELGIWDGASAVFWFEHFDPDKLVAVDISTRGDTDYFRRYVETRADGRLSTYWGTDQSDSARLLDIVGRECAGPLDVVIDDASHRYHATKASFEALFPLLRPGGVFIIEDWSWEYTANLRPRDRGLGLARLVVPLVELAGTQQGVVADVTVSRWFVAVERGKADVETARALRLADPTTSPMARARRAFEARLPRRSPRL